MKKEDVDLANAFVWIPDSKTASGVAEVPLTDVRSGGVQKTDLDLGCRGLTCFPTQITRPAIRPVSRRSGRRRFGRREFLTSEFTISDRRMRLGSSAGGVADEWVTQLLRQGDAKVFKKYSQMKLQMKREALAKLNRKANDKGNSGTGEAA